MISNIASSQGVETFQVSLEGWMVECDSIEDAVAVRNAESILATRNHAGYTPAELERLAALLVRYGRKSAAVHLRRCAKQQCAAAAIHDTAVMKP